MSENIMELSFIIDKQTITRTDSNQPVEFSKNYLIAKFEFSSDWDNTKKVLFVQYENRYYNLVDILEDNTYIEDVDYDIRRRIDDYSYLAGSNNKYLKSSSNEYLKVKVGD